MGLNRISIIPIHLAIRWSPLVSDKWILQIRFSSPFHDRHRPSFSNVLPIVEWVKKQQKIRNRFEFFNISQSNALNTFLMNKSNGTSNQTESILTFFHSNSFAYFELLFIIYASALNEHTTYMHPICIFSIHWSNFYANIEEQIIMKKMVDEKKKSNQLRVVSVVKTTRSRDNVKIEMRNKLFNYYYVSHLKRGYAY